jgi:hypothetical protein
MIRGRTLRPTRTFTPCSRGGSGAANTRRGPGCLRLQNWRTNSAAGPTLRPGRSGHSNETGWPGGFSEGGTYRLDRMLIPASHDAPSRLRPQPTSAPPPFVSPVCLRTRGSTGIISRTYVSRTSAHACVEGVVARNPGCSAVGPVGLLVVTSKSAMLTAAGLLLVLVNFLKPGQIAGREP